jgi:hypothetical protein
MTWEVNNDGFWKQMKLGKSNLNFNDRQKDLKKEIFKQKATIFILAWISGFCFAVAMFYKG